MKDLEKEAAEISEEDGVKYIQALLQLGGDTEPKEKSLENWRKFGAYDKLNTRAAYRLLTDEGIKEAKLERRKNAQKGPKSKKAVADTTG